MREPGEDDDLDEYTTIGDEFAKIDMQRRCGLLPPRGQDKRPWFKRQLPTWLVDMRRARDVIGDALASNEALLTTARNRYLLLKLMQEPVDDEVEWGKLLRAHVAHLRAVLIELNLDIERGFEVWLFGDVAEEWWLNGGRR